jgi:hypothetical protein
MTRTLTLVELGMRIHTLEQLGKSCIDHPPHSMRDWHALVISPPVSETVEILDFCPILLTHARCLYLPLRTQPRLVEVLLSRPRDSCIHQKSKHVQLNSKVISTIWDEDAGKWKIKVEVDGAIVEDEADILVNGSGFLK